MALVGGAIDSLTGGNGSVLGTPSESDPFFFPGQLGAGAGLFGPGGLFEQIAQGRPTPGFERALNSGSDRLQRTFAQRGLTGSGIEAKGLTEFEQGAAQQVADNQVSQIFSAIQPPGTTQTGGQPGLFGQIFGKS